MDNLQLVRLAHDSAVIYQGGRSFESLVSDFVQYADISPKSMHGYMVGIKRFISFLHDGGITEPKRNDVIAFRNMLLTTVKPSTTQLYITSVKIFFKFLAQYHMYENIADGIKGARIDHGFKKDYLSAVQAGALVNGAKDLKEKAMLALMLTSGLRTIEVSRANIGDLRIHGGKTVLYIQGKGRSEKTDFVPVSEKVAALIHDYLATRKGVSIDDPLFASNSNHNFGGRITSVSISRIVAAALKRAGLKTDRITAHSLRHTSATLALKSGMDFRKVSMLLRHANLKTTMIYTHDLDQADNDCADVVANSFLA